MHTFSEHLKYNIIWNIKLQLNYNYIIQISNKKYNSEFKIKASFIIVGASSTFNGRTVITTNSCY